MDVALRAIAEPHRRAILRLAWDQERSASELASYFPLTRQAISQHIRVLRESGLLAERREGTRRMYRARQERVEQIQAELTEYWTTSLEAIKDDLESGR